MMLAAAVAIGYRCVGALRFTADLDILIRPEPANAARVLEALREFGFGEVGIDAGNLTSTGQVIQLGVKPNRIDILTSVSGVSFEEAWADRVEGNLDGIPAHFIGLTALSRNKENTGRAKAGSDFPGPVIVYVYTYMMLRSMFLKIGLLTIGFAVFALAQSPAPPAAGPTTRVLAIGRITDGTTTEKLTPVMQQEVRDTVRLYLAGKLDQWFSRRDERGVVFLLNVSSVAEARALLEALPLGKAKFMSFDLIPLGPLAPLGILTAEPAPAAK